MKITIDTKEDSHQEIQKVIKMLSSLVGQEVMSNQRDLFDDSTSSSDILVDDSSKAESPNMFGDSVTDTAESSDSSNSSSSGGGMFNMFNSDSGSSASPDDAPEETQETTEDSEEEKKDDDIGIPGVEEYH